MNKFRIQGETSLNGTVAISGAKNAVLPIMFATILAKSTVTLHNVPNLKDIVITCQILRDLGIKVEHLVEENTLIIDPSDLNSFSISDELAHQMRASIWALAPLVARFNNGIVPLPGGCKIGSRPIDMHLDGLVKMGTEIVTENNHIYAKAKNGLQGSHIVMNKISVGATISVIIAAAMAKGQTIIENPALEPEVIDTAEFLNTLGAKIKFENNKIIVNGVSNLNGGTYTVIPDRIETGTFLIAAAISKGKITCTNTKSEHLTAVLEKLTQAGMKIEIDENSITLDAQSLRPNAVDIDTHPYPSFPTDMQAQFTLLNAIGKGESTITENIFENRFMHIPELNKMGAEITTNGNKAFCKGVENLTATTVKATDLRASISLVLAGCIAKGETIIEDIYHIDRGYENIEQKLTQLGAKIERF